MGPTDLWLSCSMREISLRPLLLSLKRPALRRRATRRRAILLAGPPSRRFALYHFVPRVAEADGSKLSVVAMDDS
jgi:hypothetical protein